MTNRCWSAISKIDHGDRRWPHAPVLFLSWWLTFSFLVAPLLTCALDAGKQEASLRHKIDEARTANDPSAQCKLQSELAILYAEQKKLPEGFKVARSAIETATANHLETGHAEALASLAYLYEVAGDDMRSFESFLEAAYLVRSQAAPLLTFWIRYHLGNLQYRAENYDESNIQLRLALKEYEQTPALFTGNRDVLSALNTIALNYRKLGQYDSAVYFHKKCMRMARGQNARFWQDLSLGNIGIAMVGQARYDSAFELIANDLTMSLKNREWRSAAVDYVYLGEILDHQHAVAKAQHYFDSAYAIMTRERITLLYFFHKAAEHYRYREDYRKSQEYLARYLSLRDSMHIQKNSKRLIMAQLRNEFDKKQLEVELVTKDNELKSVQLKNHRITLAVTLVAIAIAGMLVFRLYRSNVDEKRVTRMLEEKVRKRTWRLAKVNRELDTFIYRSSHDLRRPLTTLLGLDNLGQLTVKDEAARQLLQKVGETARGMDHMLTKLRYIHELNQRSRKRVECNLSDIVLEELEKVQTELTKNNIAVSTSLAFHQQLKTDAGIVRLIVSNLLENAIQFRHPRVPNHIHLNTGILEGNYCYVEVADTGIGIDKGIMERIYTPFFRGSEYSHGSGLGLFLVKNAVEALKGKIFLESESGKGSRFTVAIPTDV